MAMCRACLLTETDLIPMDVPFLENFNMLTGLGLCITDKTLYICKTCCNEVNSFIKFREKCIQSDLRIHEESITVQEIKLENELFIDEDSKDTIEDFIDEDIKEDNVKLTVKEEQIKYGFISTSGNESTELEEYCPEIKSDESTANESADEKKKKRSTKRKSSKTGKKLGKRKKSEKLEPLSKEIDVDEKQTDAKIHCGLCELQFDNRAELTKHLDNHKSRFQTQISCGLCTERFINLPHMLGHRIEHIPLDQKICHICSKKYITASATCLEFHYMRAHEMAEKDENIKCKQCTSSYPTSSKLIRHVRSCHSALRYKCENCGKGFRNTTLLNIHTNISHSDISQTYKCKYCDVTSKYPNGLTQHVRRKHSAVKFKCKVCNRFFADEESLERHTGVCKHHNRVVCSICGTSIKNIYLKHHMRSHSDEFFFKCDQCPAKYKYKTGLRDHLVKHEGKMNHHCHLCTKSFMLKGSLRAHLKSHSDGKPFVCNVCNISFKRKFNLQVHMRVHVCPAAETSNKS